MIMGVAEKSVVSSEIPQVAIVERYPDREEQVLHLAFQDDIDVGKKTTVCGRPFDHATRIPFESWGNGEERVFCKWCRRGLSKDNLRRRALRLKLRQQLQQRELRKQKSVEAEAQQQHPSPQQQQPSLPSQKKKSPQRSRKSR